MTFRTTAYVDGMMRPLLFLSFPLVHTDQTIQQGSENRRYIHTAQ